MFFLQSPILRKHKSFCFFFADEYSLFCLAVHSNMLEIKNLSVNVGEKNILNQISLDFELGKNYCILGKNGSGKSSLAMTLMGHPNYTIVEGDLFLDGVSLKGLSPDERAKRGIFLAFQQIPEIP